ncbi:insulin-like growth factor-binding protein 2 isoform X2 [Aplysia californica]|uniref:Insulin-like growth factor-binding protein 2 isoform X2 n=1 Tax=Aplysia californica TaxID=6500 RepID=A0ABM0ZVY8_APLCA|nr:insulin-like growth factor-binding protein 2 isoform X2 [Aplysia californica]
MLIQGFMWNNMSSYSAIVCTLMLLTLLCDLVLGFKCPPCNKIHCSPRRASKLQCKGGITTGVCGCCPACAKVEGESCGGDYAYRGKCDRGLYCVPSSTTAYISRVHTLQKEPVGVCKKMSKKQARQHQSDAAFVEFCRPKCTASFCRKHPRAICSARKVKTRENLSAKSQTVRERAAARRSSNKL